MVAYTVCPKITIPQLPHFKPSEFCFYPYSSSFAYLLFQVPKSTISAKLLAAKSGICEDFPRTVSCGSALNAALQSNECSVFLRTQPSCEDWPMLDKPRPQLTGVPSPRLSAEDAGRVHMSAESRASVQSRLCKNQRGRKGDKRRGDDFTKTSSIQSTAWTSGKVHSVRHFYLLWFSLQLLQFSLFLLSDDMTEFEWEH